MILINVPSLKTFKFDILTLGNLRTISGSEILIFYPSSHKLKSGHGTMQVRLLVGSVYALISEMFTDYIDTVFPTEMIKN